MPSLLRCPPGGPSHPREKRLCRGRENFDRRQWTSRNSGHGPQAAHPRDTQFSEARYSVLRHFHSACPPARLASHGRPDLLVGIESRGFLVAAPLAYELERGFAMVRKRGKLPGKTVRFTYDLEYGTDTLEIQEDAVASGQRVVVLDDLVATGGTMQAAIDLVRQRGGEVVGAGCIIELIFLRGRDRIDVPFTSMVAFDS